MVRTAFHSGFSRYPYSSLLRQIGTMAMHGSHAVSSAAGLHSWPVLSSFPPQPMPDLGFPRVLPPLLQALVTR